MNVWDSYETRIETLGGTKRGTSKKREIRYIHNKLPDNLSYQLVTLFDPAHTYNIESTEMQNAAVEQNVAIINSDNLNEKYIFSMPGEDIECGSIIHWMDNYWLVDEKDANTTLYTRAKLLQCNYLLRWVNNNDEICEQWCMIEDGTKLKCIFLYMHDSLVYWKRYTKRIPLIAGNSLELYTPQHTDERCRGAMD